MKAEKYFNQFGFYKVMDNEKTLIYARDKEKNIGFIVFYKEPQAYKTDLPIEKFLHYFIDLQMDELGWFDEILKKDLQD